MATTAELLSECDILSFHDLYTFLSRVELGVFVIAIYPIAI